MLIMDKAYRVPMGETLMSARERKKLAAFRRKAQNDRIYATFRDDEHFHEQVIKSLRSLREALERRGLFFQAEDGIRPGRVTGVQTCALPIFPARKFQILDPMEPDRARRQALMPREILMAALGHVHEGGNQDIGRDGANQDGA